MLIIKNLTIQTIKYNRILLQDLSFSLMKNDKIAIIGEEGNGKSTLLKAICKSDEIMEYVKIEGSIDLQGDIVGYLPQNIDSKWDSTDGFDYLYKNDVNDEIGLEVYNEYNELYSILNKVKLNEDVLYRDIGKCSGGEKVKLGLAKVLLSKPNILILDEPTNDLDIETLEFLEDFIRNSVIPVLFVTHDETLLENVANGILHLEQINRKTKSRWTFERIGYREYIEKRSMLHDRISQIAVSEKRKHDEQMEKYRHLYERVNHELNTVSRQDPATARLLKKKMKAVKSIGRRLENEELTHKEDVEEEIELFFDDSISLSDSKVILEMNNETIRIGDNILIDEMSLDIRGKDKVCIIGNNGCGKTTLLKGIEERLKNRQDIMVGYMPQNYEELLDLSVNAVSYLAGDNDKAYHSMVATRLGSLNFTRDEMNTSMNKLSQGQKAKILLLKLVLSKANVLLLDEPTRNLSPLTSPVIRNMLGDYGGCIISISHDRKYIDEVCNVVYKINNRKFLKLW